MQAGMEPAPSPLKRGWRKKSSETGAEDGETRVKAPSNVESEDPRGNLPHHLGLGE